MKEVCGYKGLDGKFYETEKECKKADLYYKVRDVERVLSNFHVHLQNQLVAHRDSSVSYEYTKHESYILEMVAKCVLRDSDKFIEIINKKKKLEKELDKLRKLQKNKEQFSYTWWLNIKWW